MPDYGTARCDFPGGDARTMYRSIRRILAYHPQTVLWMCHDYRRRAATSYAWRTTVGAEREQNPQVRDGISEDEFVALREARDATLGTPKLLIPSIQVNMRAGHMPPPEDNGTTLPQGADQRDRPPGELIATCSPPTGGDRRRSPLSRRRGRNGRLRNLAIADRGLRAALWPAAPPRPIPTA